MNQNLYQAFAEVFSDHPAAPVLHLDDGTVIDYATLDAMSARYANLLLALGAETGDRVTVQCDKSVETLWLYLGTIRAGLVYHPLNNAYQENELAYFLSNAAPRIVVGDSTTLPTLKQLAAADATVIGVTALAERATAASDQFQTVTSAAADLAALLYSSGTTGVPKGIMLTHGNLASNARTLVESWGFTRDDVLLHALPVFHVHGLFVALNLALMNGGSVIMLPKFDPDAVLDAMPDSTVMMGVPTYYTRLLADQRFNRDVSGHMRLFISGSAPLLVETSDEFFERTGQRILERYGMTETGMSCSNPLNGDRRAGSVGPPLPGVEVRIVDENGAELPRGEIGSLEVRGEHVFKGYWKLPEKTAAEFKGDWFITGDMATLSDDGYVSIVGRGKDLIISGGLNIYPKEIEDVLNDQDGVVESAVVGVPHPDFGEGIVAVLVGEQELDMETLQAACRGKLAGFKVPRRWIQLDSLPRNTMGKVQKNLLRDDYIESFK